MSPALKDLKTREVVAAFRHAGWDERKRHAGTKHLVLTHPESDAILTIPQHRTLKQGLVRGLIRASGLTVEEFLELL